MPDGNGDDLSSYLTSAGPDQKVAYLLGFRWTRVVGLALSRDFAVPFEGRPSARGRMGAQAEGLECKAVHPSSLTALRIETVPSSSAML